MTFLQTQDATKVKQGMHFVADILMRKANELVADHKKVFADFFPLYHGLAKLGFDGFPKSEQSLWANLSSSRKLAVADLRDYAQPETVTEFSRTLQVIARLACLNLVQETVYFNNEGKERTHAIKKLSELSDIKDPKAKEKAAQEIIATEERFMDRRIPKAEKQHHTRWRDRKNQQPLFVGRKFM